MTSIWDGLDPMERRFCCAVLELNVAENELQAVFDRVHALRDKADNAYDALTREQEDRVEDVCAALDNPELRDAALALLEEPRKP